MASYDTEHVALALAFVYASAAVDSRAGSMVPVVAEVLHSRTQEGTVKEGTGVMQEVQSRDGDHDQCTAVELIDYPFLH